MAPAAPLVMSISRRQNSSCDQCRRGKRACDAVWLRDRQLQRAREVNGLSDETSSELSSQGGTFSPSSFPVFWSHGGEAQRVDPLMIRLRT